MRILLTGAHGFIGRHLSSVLAAHGHTVVGAGRSAARVGYPHCEALVEADFTRGVDPGYWIQKLQRIDAVINAVGILREHGSQNFASLHVEAPSALFDACVIVGVSRVINISALGADENAASAYHLSKRRADQHLERLPLEWTIVQPSLVYGSGGQSARLFTMLASLPWIPLPGAGTQLVQPIHIDDLTAGIAALLTSSSGLHQVVPFVGPHGLTLRQFLTQLRASMHLPPARFIHVPLGLVRTLARIGARVPGSLLDADTFGMLLRGNVGDAAPLRSLLGRELRRPGEFIAEAEATCSRTLAQLSWLLPLLRWSVALVWIVTGIVSLGLFPIASSYELLARAGVPEALAPFFLYGAAVLDLALGISILVMRRRQYLWLTQAALIVFYMLVISVRMPEFWLHPYGPLLKNLPMLAVIALLYSLERR